MMERQNYVSCIRIGNRPILPPLIDTPSRELIHCMRRKAVEIEKMINDRKRCNSSDANLYGEQKLSLKPDNVVNYSTDSSSVGEMTDVSINLSELNDMGVSNEKNYSRRNSYTLDGPSEIMLKHLRYNLSDNYYTSSNISNNNYKNNSDDDDTLVTDDSSFLTEDTLTSVRIIENKVDESDDLECSPTVRLKEKTTQCNNNIENDNNYYNDNYIKDKYVEDEDNDNFVRDKDDYIADDGDHYVNDKDNYIEDNDNYIDDNDDRIKLESDEKIKNDLNSGHKCISDYYNFIHCDNVETTRKTCYSKSSPNYEDNCHRNEYKTYIDLFHRIKTKHTIDLLELLEKQKIEQTHLFAEFKNNFDIENDRFSLRDDQNSNKSVLVESSCVTCNLYSEKKICNKKMSNNNNNNNNNNNDDNNKNLPTSTNEQVEIISSSLNDNTNVIISHNDVESSNDVKTEVGIIERDLIKKKCKAATVITAAVRGYLTRRLFKTQRVSYLVNVIKDCLNIAISLQNEKNLSLSDLNLQSRLLQQLIGSYNELHEIFALPVKERMKIIANDIQPKKSSFSFVESNSTPRISGTTKQKLLRRLMDDCNYKCENRVMKNNAIKRNGVYRKQQCSSSLPGKCTSVKNNPVISVAKSKSTMKSLDRPPWR